MGINEFVQKYFYLLFFTVFQRIFCYFLFQTGEMEVHNPLFQDDPTPKANK